jgi:hypothetical protein
MTPDASPTAGTRFDEEGDWIVRQFISPADLRLEPEEYVARHAHALGGFSFHFYRFRDPGLGAWVRRVGELLASSREVERCWDGSCRWMSWPSRGARMPRISDGGRPARPRSHPAGPTAAGPAVLGCPTPAHDRPAAGLPHSRPPVPAIRPLVGPGPWRNPLADRTGDGCHPAGPAGRESTSRPPSPRFDVSVR